MVVGKLDFFRDKWRAPRWSFAHPQARGPRLDAPATRAEDRTETRAHGCVIFWAQFPQTLERSSSGDAPPATNLAENRPLQVETG